MTTLDFLQHLRSLGINVQVAGEQLQCKAPKGVLTPALRAELAERKAEILAFLQNVRHTSLPPLPPSPLPRDRDIPLSFGQERLWFLDQLEPNNPCYNVPTAIRLKGHLRVSALTRSLCTLIQRHEALRTVFTTNEDYPVQVIAPPTQFDLPLVDLQALPADERESKLRTLVSAEAQRPFDLSRGPLIRIILFRLSQTEHTLVLNIHHIVSDGWSFAVLIGELEQLYRAYSTNSALPLAPLPIQYADYAIWQRTHLQNEVLEEQLAYWRRQLEHLPDSLDLPTDRSCEQARTLHGSSHEFVVSRALTEDLKALSRQRGVTLFMTLLAGLSILLFRYTGQDDIVIGSPTAGRSHPALAGLVGFFVNTLVLRTDLSGDPTFLELLMRVRQTCLEAYAHQDIPFHRLVETLHPARGLNHSPLFRVAFQHLPLTPPTLSELTLEPVQIHSGTSKFDMSLTFLEMENQLIGQLEYNTDLFSSSMIERFSDHLRTLLTSIAAQPEQRISRLSFITAAEQQQLLVEWNNTAVDYRQDKDIHQLFEEQVERTPDAIALHFKDEQVTYGELNRRANQLAHYLRKRGVGAEVPVGICLERSIEMVVALFGILKAGGAYVPLDPTYPQERLAFLLGDTQMPILLTRQSLTQRIPDTATRLVYLDTDWETIAQEPVTNLESRADLETTVAIIYTSGSTGKPKGTVIVRRGFLNLCLWYSAFCPITQTSRVLVMLPFSFDAAFKNIVSPLLVGGQAVLGDAVPYDAVVLFHTIRDQQVTVINSTPSLFHPILELAKEDGYRSLASLKYVGLGGEAIVLPRLRPWFASQYCSCTIAHMYGPTECSDILTSHRVSREELFTQEKAPVGKPISNVRLYVLDASGNLQPPGLAGELFAAGHCLARNLLNRPELTAEKFLPNPYVPGERIYSTGDRARWLPDGSLEILGRVDHQVKIRGIRIELGEIDAQIRSYPTVRESITLARENGQRQKILVAYVVPTKGETLSPNELRDFLKQRIPQYMIPSAFLVLEALPLTHNGKIDVRSLPAPEFRPELDENFVPPGNATQEALANIWIDLLGLERVGIHDSFFELGGHSLLATQFIFRVRDAFQVNLPLRDFFTAPTIAGVERALEASRQTGPIPRSALIDTLDLNKEAVLDPAIVPEAPSLREVTEPEHVFLTGATGFLGAFLLHELLQQTSAHIYCLVRAQDVCEGEKKLQNALASYSLWTPEAAERIIPVIGSLSQPRLGWSEQEFLALAEKIEVIYHSGAEVNFVYPYHTLKNTNVLGTQEILRLACCGRAKTVQYISTLSVFSPEASTGPITEEESLHEHAQFLQEGYSQSKWVAERLVALARDRGLPVNIYRPGRIGGDSQTGCCNTDDFFWLMLKGCIQLGYAPAVEGLEYMAPVDYVSKAIVYLSRQRGLSERNFHLSHPQPVKLEDLFSLLHNLGYPLQLVSYQQWLEKLENATRQSTANALYPLLPAILSSKETAQQQGALRAPQTVFSCQDTLDALAPAGITCPPLDHTLLSTYFSYFLRTGFIDAYQS